MLLTNLLRRLSFILFTLVLFTSLSGFAAIPTTGSDLPQPAPDPRSSLPTLSEFSAGINNGDAASLVGLYVPDKFAFPIVQQPKSNPGYISEKDDTLTQFRTAASYGTTGLLAHNYLGGSHFTDIAEGDVIYLVKGDGSLLYYQVTEIVSYQALQPNNPYSSFVNLSNPKEKLNSTDLFMQIYAKPGNLILQTCIQKDKEPSWGRLFIIASPIETVAALP